MKRLGLLLLALTLAPAIGQPPPGSELAKLVDVQTQFALKLLAGQPSGKTAFLSPFSIYQVLTMAYVGAKRDTKAELAKALGVDAANDQWLSVNGQLASRLVAEGNQGKCRFRNANALYLSDQVQVRPEYLAQASAAVSGAMVSPQDFTQPGRVEATVNQWVSDQTKGRIPAILAPDSVSPRTSLIGVNAVFFKARWQSVFEPRLTKPEPFKLLTGESVDVPTMQRQLLTYYASGPGWQAAWLPYEGGPFTTFIILPSAGQFETYATGFGPPQLAAVRASAQRVLLRIHLPRFDATVNTDLCGPMQAMGIRKAFAAADFSGIGIDPRGPMYVEKLTHQAMVKVDEEGTEAAAATAMGVVPGGDSPELPKLVEMRVDRPFIFLITDRMTGTILFAGRILDPRG
mgnify:CR=1 FL=1